MNNINIKNDQIVFTKTYTIGYRRMESIIDFLGKDGYTQYHIGDIEDGYNPISNNVFYNEINCMFELGLVQFNTFNNFKVYELSPSYKSIIANIRRLNNLNILTDG